MKIPFFDYPRLFLDKKDEYMNIFSDVASRGAFIMQDDVNIFEKNLSIFSSSKYAIGVGNATDGLEISWMALNLRQGDEVICCSHTMLATASAIKVAGGIPIPVEIGDDNLIDPDAVEDAITSRTVGIMPTQLNGRTCDMERIMKIANKYKLYVVEDAAQGMMSEYNGRPLGTIGHFGTYSFHETKNYTSAGEGGLLIINDKKFEDRAEIIREKGTNRSQFFRGMIDKYSWVDLGSSYLMNDVSAAYLWGNLQRRIEINQSRLNLWQKYYQLLEHLQEKQFIDLPTIPQKCIHNAHMFYLKVRDLKTRSKLIEHLKQNNISSVFHYVPLHSSFAGKKFGIFEGEDKFTTCESERIIRLPMYYGLDSVSVKKICQKIDLFFKNL